MSKYSDAATVIKKAAVKYEQMVSLAKVLEEIGSLEQVAKEQAVAADAARAEATKAKDDLAKAKDKIKAADEKAAAVLAEANAQAGALVDEARKAAEVDAANILKKAHDEAALMVAQASTVKAQLSSEIGGLQRAVEAAKAELKHLTAAKEDAEKATADAERKLTVLREKIKALLG
jgi:chromosome segregation ATPase